MNGPGRSLVPRKPVASRRVPAPLAPVPAAAPTRRAAAAAASAALDSPPLRSSSPTSNGSSSQKNGKKDAEGNIQVVVRCRGLSSQEISQSSPLCAVAHSTRGTTVSLTNPSSTITTSSSAALVPAPTLPATKTYDFGERVSSDPGRPSRGNVFGADADQGMIYNDVAKPILQQVLQGYNCTIFAYGQTGTGKTFTMEGDLSPYHGTFAPSAGIIPRTLYALFDKLAEDRAEFSVRVSFVELYNEELRDLNALEFSEPLAAGQPMDSRTTTSATNLPGGTTTGAAAGAGGLRIYDDKAGTGVVIQGLEESLISCAEDGLKILKRGSERRQIGATRCNEQSSRSHSIFTIVVHIKESTTRTGGEDLLKVGKLNLVDLAGSENVGRSGAEKGRAREAGMINASLLALGRVINKLVEKQSHIPYRESKLTRLLQDSLGGRTKTTIIATISPVNFEETISTLDYAARAKRIENRPEVNQRMTKGALLSQYATEIERLKSDLLAAREKNGVFFSEASWAELASEQDTRRLQLEEAKRQVEINDSLLMTTRAQFEQNLRLLGTREDELKRVSGDLRKTSADLVKSAKELGGTRGRLEGETVLREAFEKSRRGWKGAAGDAFGDADGLFAKIDRKSRVESLNLAVINSATTSLLSTTSSLSSQVDSFRGTQQDFSTQLKDRLSDFASQQAEVVTSSLSRVDERLAELGDAATLLVHANGQADAQGQAFLALVEQSRADLVASVEEHARTAMEQQAAQAEAILGDLEEHAGKTLAVIEMIAKPMAALQEESQSWRTRDAERLRLLQDEDRAALADENARLKALVDHLTTTLEQQRSQAINDDAALVALLTQSLQARSTKFVDQLEASYGVVRTGLEGVVVAHAGRNVARGEQLGNLAQSNVAAGVQLDRRATEVEVASVEGRTMVENSFKAVHDGLASHRQDVEATARKQVDLVTRTATELESGAATFRTDASTSHARMEEDLEALASATREGYSSYRSDLESLGQDAEVTTEGIRLNLDAHSLQTTSFLDSATSDLSSLQNAITTSLSRDIQPDVATGATPKKREWPRDVLLPIVDLDGDRDEVLRVLRGKETVSPPGSPVIIATVVPAARGPALSVLAPHDVNVKRTGGQHEVAGKKVLGQLR
ncbi:hypothetical protein RQP46_008946 [Phenoliferia psychrophenolica]